MKNEWLNRHDRSIIAVLPDGTVLAYYSMTRQWFHETVSAEVTKREAISMKKAVERAGVEGATVHDRNFNFTEAYRKRYPERFRYDDTPADDAPF